jgi:hypothetical protein
MASVLFWKCECGIEWKALFKSEGATTTFDCLCGRRQQVTGVIVALHYLPRVPDPLDPGWKHAPEPTIGTLDFSTPS